MRRTGRIADYGLGKPAGSAVPLVWAHAEYLKLLRSALDGKVFDRVDPVYERYSKKEEMRQRGNLEIWCRRRPIQRIDAGKMLRILDVRKFEVVWSANGWRTVQTTPSRSMGSAGYSADIAARNGERGDCLDFALAGAGQLAWIQCGSDG